MKRLDGMDAMFLHTETATQYMHTLKVAVFDPAQGGQPYAFADQFDHIRNLLHRVPPCRWKALPVPFNIHHPVWINDPHFDLGLHVHRAALPAPAGEAELWEFVENIASAPLNRDRPLWELWLVENYLGDKVAAVAKVHHALADGLATAGMLEDLMTPQPGESTTGDQPYHPEQAPSAWQGFWWAVADLLRDLLKIPRQIAAIRAAKKKQQARNLPLAQRPPDPYSGPFTCLNRAISSHRKFCFGSVALDDVKAVSKHFGVSITDVVLTMAGGAVREFLRQRGELPAAPLTATVPASTRGPETIPTYGNKVSALSVSLCTDIGDWGCGRAPACHSPVGSRGQARFRGHPGRAYHRFCRAAATAPGESDSGIFPALVETEQISLFQCDRLHRAGPARGPF